MYGDASVEDDYTAPSTFTKRKYGIGARGVDFIENWSNSTTIASTQFPIYDCHGNMIATFERPTSTPTLGNTRYFDAWGNPSNTGGPKQRYCASLGHVQDDESGLNYMRARYYEPGTGRFVSEDRCRQGLNWSAYAGCDPINFSDSSGNATGWDGLLQLMAMISGGMGFVLFMSIGVLTSCGEMTAAQAEKAATLACIAFALSESCSVRDVDKVAVVALKEIIIVEPLIRCVAEGCEVAGRRLPGIGKIAVGLLAATMYQVIAELYSDWRDEGAPFGS